MMKTLDYLGLDSKNVKKTVEWLKEKKVACEEVRMDPVTGKPFTFFKDPDGLPLELYEQ